MSRYHMVDMVRRRPWHSIKWWCVELFYGLGLVWLMVILIVIIALLTNIGE